MRTLIAAESYSLVEFAFIIALGGGGNVPFLVPWGDSEFPEPQGRAQMNFDRTGQSYVEKIVIMSGTQRMLNM
jgi:hypothetical protein